MSGRGRPNSPVPDYAFSFGTSSCGDQVGAHLGNQFDAASTTIETTATASHGRSARDGVVGHVFRRQRRVDAANEQHYRHAAESLCWTNGSGGGFCFECGSNYGGLGKAKTKASVTAEAFWTCRTFRILYWTSNRGSSRGSFGPTTETVRICSGTEACFAEPSCLGFKAGRRVSGSASSTAEIRDSANHAVSAFGTTANHCDAVVCHRPK